MQFKSNSHKITEKNLLRQSFETFLQIHEIKKTVKSKNKIFLKPLFPSYMFISCDNELSQFHKINNTYGVNRLISFNNLPKAIPQIFITELKQHCDQTGKFLLQSNLKKGDRVKISNGPFSNFIATIEKLDAENRVWLLMDLINASSRISISASNLQQIKNL